MNVILLFLAAIAAIIIWWLSGQRLTSKPWLETGSVQLPDQHGTERPPVPAVKIGLFVFLGVVGALFSLAVSAYFMAARIRLVVGDAAASGVSAAGAHHPPSSFEAPAFGLRTSG